MSKMQGRCRLTALFHLRCVPVGRLVPSLKAGSLSEADRVAFAIATNTMHARANSPVWRREGFGEGANGARNYAADQQPKRSAQGPRRLRHPVVPSSTPVLSAVDAATRKVAPGTTISHISIDALRRPRAKAGIDVETGESILRKCAVRKWVIFLIR